MCFTFDVCVTTAISKSVFGNNTFKKSLHHHCPGRDTNLTGGCLDYFFYVPPLIVLLEPALPPFVDLWYAVIVVVDLLSVPRFDVLAIIILPYRSVSVAKYVTYSSQFCCVNYNECGYPLVCFLLHTDTL